MFLECCTLEVYRKKNSVLYGGKFIELAQKGQNHTGWKEKYFSDGTYGDLNISSRLPPSI
jgi:hypothetical protein